MSGFNEVSGWLAHGFEKSRRQLLGAGLNLLSVLSLASVAGPVMLRVAREAGWGLGKFVNFPGLLCRPESYLLQYLLQ